MCPSCSRATCPAGSCAVRLAAAQSGWQLRSPAGMLSWRNVAASAGFWHELGLGLRLELGLGLGSGDALNVGLPPQRRLVGPDARPVLGSPHDLAAGQGPERR